MWQRELEREREKKGERERGRKKEANIQNSRKSRPCCAKLLQLFLFLLACSFGFTFSATAVHMSRKASSMAGQHGGGRGEDRVGKEVVNRVQGSEGKHIKAFLSDSFVEALAIEFRCT